MIANAPTPEERVVLEKFGFKVGVAYVEVEASDHEAALRAGCDECHRPYGDEYGFPDLVIPNHLWRLISFTKDECGALCPSCMLKRLWEAGVRQCPGAFMSGAVWSVDRFTMEALRRAENVQETLEACGIYR